MADPATMMCNNTDHSILVATIGEQTRLITQLFGKIQDLERKLELAQEAARNPIVAQSPPIQAPNFAASAAEGSYVSQQDYSSQPPSAYESKKAHAQSQPCSYGSRCTREQCWYDHSGSTPGENSKSSNSANQSQTTGNSSKRIKQECKYGINCTRKQCWFEHPSDWVSPNSETQESQPQQEFGTEPPAAEASNWGTNEDSSGWGAPPSNDWGVPVDNTWGPSTEADNGWGNPAETSWNSHSGDQHKSPVNNSRSTSVNMSREGSVSNASTNKSQGRGRKARGKGGRRADSESIATESTPMSPSPLATTFTPADVEPITIQTPFSAPIEPTGQTPSYSETNLDEMSTPPLEPSVPSLSSEPEAPATPKALWSDEPTIDVVHFPETPLGLNEPPTSESFPEEQAATEFVDESFGLDQSAPSDLYSSWGVTGVTASDWGLDPIEFPDPTPTLENKTSGKKSKSKGKGKQKESSQTGTAGHSTPSNSSNYAAQSETSLPPINEVNHPEPEPEIKPTPDPPKGVPQDEIPDWLLGADEDAHAVLGIPRSTSPHPETSTAPPRLAPTNPAPRPPLSKLAAENFPALGGLSYKPPQTKDDTSSTPAFTPRPVGWKITRSSDTSSTSGKSGKGSKPNSDWGKK